MLCYGPDFMVVTIEPRVLLDMLETTGGNEPSDPRMVCLLASQGRLALQYGGAQSERQSIVWNEGQCRLGASELLSLLKPFQLESAVTLETLGGFLRVRHSAVPVLSSCAWTATSERSQTDFATD
jgi:hypothetical protein